MDKQKLRNIIIWIGVMLFLVIFYIVFIDSSYEKAYSKFELERYAIDAECAELSFDSCEGELTAGDTKGECYWNEERELCLGENFQQIE